MSLTVLDLFSGIGGFTLGLDRTGGFRTVAFCECNSYAQCVLLRHWPTVPCFGDVKELSKNVLDAVGIGQIDVVCGGFPCQDISTAGKGGGLGGARSGLWYEFARIIGEVRPKWVIVENVAILRSRGLDAVLGSLAALGYDAEWHCISAAAVGAPHRRDRVWIIAYSNSKRCNRKTECAETEQKNAEEGDVANADYDPGGRNGRRFSASQGAAQSESDTIGPWNGRGSILRDLNFTSDWWLIEPNVGRVVDGVSDELVNGEWTISKSFRVDRLRCLGNAVVPQIPELIGRAILEAETKGRATL